ncbi:MAG: T9SS type A sorting domain-containing protein [Flavobacteriales bacterium]|nr:T9SS type A sorting domain-containing protein [Flavobacteriales bacterium]
MRKTLLPILLVIATRALAQPCTPNPLYADSLFGVWPDTTTNFTWGTMGQPYFQDLNLIVPQNAGVINPAFEGQMIDSVAFTGISGLPNGLAVLCNSQTGAPCSYITGQLGCGVIQGTPTEHGDFPLVLNVLAYTNLFGNVIPIPYSFTGYKIFISQSVSVQEVAMVPGLGHVRNVPNPFSVRTQIEFQMARAGEVRVRVFNLLGEELWKQTLHGKAGINRIPFENRDLQEGVYLYKVESGKEAFTGRMVLQR